MNKNINPRDYDVQELRDVSSNADPENIKDPDEVYLEEIPRSPKKEITTLLWAHYLVLNTDKDKSVDILESYVDFGWISDKVKKEMVKRIRNLEGMSNPESGLSKYFMRSLEKNMDPELIRNATLGEHIVSLKFIIYLADDEIKSFDMLKGPIDSYRPINIVETFNGTKKDDKNKENR